MKINFIILSIMTCFTINSTYAEQTQPIKCPNPVSQAPWSYAKKSQGPFWDVVCEKNKYDTDQEWTVLVGGVRANNESESFLHATEIVKELTLIMGPDTHEEPDGKTITACGYLYIGGDSFVAAITPPQSIKKPFPKF
jgi:hypothetical protein